MRFETPCFSVLANRLFLNSATVYFLPSSQIVLSIARSGAYTNVRATSRKVAALKAPHLVS